MNGADYEGEEGEGCTPFTFIIIKNDEYEISVLNDYLINYFRAMRDCIEDRYLPIRWIRIFMGIFYTGTSHTLDSI